MLVSIWPKRGVRLGKGVNDGLALRRVIDNVMDFQLGYVALAAGFGKQRLLSLQ